MKGFRRFMSIMLSAAMLAGSVPEYSFAEALPPVTSEAAVSTQNLAEGDSSQLPGETTPPAQSADASQQADQNSGAGQAASQPQSGTAAQPAAQNGGGDQSAQQDTTAQTAAESQPDTQGQSAAETQSDTQKDTAFQETANSGTGTSESTSGTGTSESASEDGTNSSANTEESGKADTETAGSGEQTAETAAENPTAAVSQAKHAPKKAAQAGTVSNVKTKSYTLTWRWNDGEREERPTAPAAAEILSWTSLKYGDKRDKTYGQDSQGKPIIDVTFPEGMTKEQKDDLTGKLTPQFSEPAVNGDEVTYTVTVPVSYDAAAKDDKGADITRQQTIDWTWTWDQNSQNRKGGYLRTFADDNKTVIYTLAENEYAVNIAWRDNCNAYGTRTNYLPKTQGKGSTFLNRLKLYSYTGKRSGAEGTLVEK